MAVTPNLGLHQWQSGDSFLRTDFNEDLGKIDGAIPRIASGTYPGDGSTGRKITVGFRPKLLILAGMGFNNPTVAFFHQAGAAWMDLSTSCVPDYSDYLTMDNTGFTLLRKDFMNKATYSYTYFALG